MAGYLFNLDSLKASTLYTKNGIYSTKLSKPNKIWRTHHESTFADYATMKKGDNVYFFEVHMLYFTCSMTLRLRSGTGYLLLANCEIIINFLFRCFFLIHKLYLRVDYCLVRPLQLIRHNAHSQGYWHGL